MLNVDRTTAAVLGIALASMLCLSGCANSADVPAAKQPAQTEQQGGSQVPYESLLTIEDAKAISGYSEVTTDALGIRLGTSDYLVIFDNPKAREFLWLRVGKGEMFDEQKRVTDGAEVPVDIPGAEAYSWSGENIDSGIAIRMNGKTYLVSHKWGAENGKSVPRLTAEQLRQAADLVVQRLQGR